ncbi:MULTISPECIES: DUF1471 domain-containing protein [Enterobacteriaceae]|uniref:DUF1471 domain-containing protein n=1 Tax=Enterobacteriaceae TaxID=543 RepID=UPI000F61DABE|nr:MULTISPECIES: DUF1471 domain-containing protein [Enterobacteriaceae]VFS07265.1 Uncharacterised protein [Citrobacter koseri]HAV1579388.1 DUF1471 domain-containing protein [Enterobacter hormaechei subsp. steigerwaltii]EKV6705119.1 DUF1471 domain-containing protein [Klebsiella pneumoniae]MCK7100316.1 DUF1471 domain-containing protein [Enterobacter kobei]RRF63799.1 DUF1471 domain-containing protein [Klebsiella pneumoniae]
MKNIMTLFVSIILPFSVCAQTETATGDTLEQTEEKIRQQADKLGDRDYKITEARMGNKVHITAEILPE